MEQLDDLRKRLRGLPDTDPDFTEPMSGATLSLYNQVDTDLNKLWDRWLQVMELWDRVGERIRAGAGLSTRATEEAKALLEGGEIDSLVRQAASCQERLDQLNRGHEEARASLLGARHDLAALQHAVSKGTGILLPSDPHHRDLETAEMALTDAELMLDEDPIGAQERIGRVRRELAAIGKPSGPSFDWVRNGSMAYPMIDDLAAAANRLREAVASLRWTSLLGLAVRAWVALWAVGLLLVLLAPLIPVVFILVIFLSMIAGAWFLVRFFFWPWLGRGRSR